MAWNAAERRMSCSVSSRRRSRQLQPLCGIGGGSDALSPELSQVTRDASLSETSGS
eukprot:CAMPEP_0177419794 /NCGR_PEP_ID=MMETSP0368-20130122/69919_1 /TAXON_ID=447022 ORGANISM="Scrippsiella hangoei-like, Strain SHHI-4" /NCGR_SAMPLE_ID=MMETSP0368 /ASSEMBLY_ACC=CAM_ASM_000363 /LENGTH=55 /DNA_ID=CAMNT_0018889557 /DNA_START=1 /DNA_END=165 /DNA_ORIENTATION=-